MSTETSIGPEGDRGGNEDRGNADGCGNKTLGEHATQRPPSGAGVVDERGAQVPAGVPGARPRSGVAQGPQSGADGRNVEARPGELDAARARPSKDR